MHKSKIIIVAGRDITALDLSPRQVDKMLDELAQGVTANNLGMVMASNLTAEAVSMSTGLEVQALLDEFSLEELAEIWRAVEEVNGFLLDRLAGIARQGMAAINEKISAN